MKTASSDIIELWFCWSVSQWDGNYQKELAKLAIAGNLVEILRGGAGYYWHIWCLHGRLFVKYLQLLRGRTKETSVKGQINRYPPWQNTMKMKTWKHNLTKTCSCGSESKSLITFFVIYVSRLLFEQAIWALGQIVSLVKFIRNRYWPAWAAGGTSPQPQNWTRAVARRD